ncbi:MAG: DUF4404 family protein [Spirochaetales bacterium]
MIDQTVHDLEARIRAATSLSPEQQGELEALLAHLKNEVAELSVHHTPGIREAVETFETRHPQLTLTVNTFSNYLANMGI